MTLPCSRPAVDGLSCGVCLANFKYFSLGRRLRLLRAPGLDQVWTDSGVRGTACERGAGPRARGWPLPLSRLRSSEPPSHHQLEGLGLSLRSSVTKRGGNLTDTQGRGWKKSDPMVLRESSAPRNAGRHSPDAPVGAVVGFLCPRPSLARR